MTENKNGIRRNHTTDCQSFERCGKKIELKKILFQKRLNKYVFIYTFSVNATFVLSHSIHREKAGLVLPVLHLYLVILIRFVHVLQAFLVCHHFQKHIGLDFYPRR